MMNKAVQAQLDAMLVITCDESMINRVKNVPSDCATFPFNLIAGSSTTCKWMLTGYKWMLWELFSPSSFNHISIQDYCNASGKDN